jgi:hypothetical protein
MRSMVEGLSETWPSTAFQAVPLPMRYAHREDKVGSRPCLDSH